MEVRVKMDPPVRATLIDVDNARSGVNRARVRVEYNAQARPRYDNAELADITRIRVVTGIGGPRNTETWELRPEVIPLLAEALNRAMALGHFTAWENDEP